MGIQNGTNLITLTRNSTGATANAVAGTTYPIVATLADPVARWTIIRSVIQMEL